MASGNYTRTTDKAKAKRDIGPYEAVVVNHLDTRYMGGLEVELIRYTGSGGTPEAGGELVQVRYLSPFYGVTPAVGLTPNDGYQNTQKTFYRLFNLIFNNFCFTSHILSR